MPTSYADLNLSSQVGNNRAKVTLKLDPNVDCAIGFRTNGEIAEIGFGASSFAGWGISGASISGSIGRISYITAITDNNGVLEWQSTASGNATLTLLEYTVY